MFHGSVVARQKKKAAFECTAHTDKGQISQVEATEDDLKAFHPVQRTDIVMPTDTTNKRKPRDNDYFVPRAPSDYHSEKGLSVVGASFGRQAASAVLDLEGDETEGGRSHRDKMKWDRKRKTFVGQTGRKAHMKKIKTESGCKISSSYKSQSYQRWRERHKIDAILPGEEEGESNRTVTELMGRSKGRRRGRRPVVTGDEGGKAGGRDKRRTVGDLKTKDFILKKRKKREFQSRRRAQKKGDGRGRGR